MTKSSKSTKWIKSHRNDHFVKKSIKENYLSRAAYKLIALNEKYNFLKKSTRVADLGCAPGSWLQVLSEYKNITLIIGIDILDVEDIEGTTILKKDILDCNNLEGYMENKKLNLVLSDIAPNITGISDIDQSNFSIIAKSILSFCEVNLEVNGLMIMKYFLGSSFEKTHKNLGNYFRKIDVFKPESSKKNSKEVYLVCIDFKP